MENENKQAENSVVIAITGGIGSGKTYTSNIIRDAGFPVLSSDETAKELTANNPVIKKKLIENFGETAFFEDGTLNKEYLAGLVFGDKEENHKSLLKLNSIVHPFVIEDMINKVQALEASGEKLIFVESALTFEANLEDGFDYIIVVDSPPEECMKRVMMRSNLTEKQVRQRMDSQINPIEKRKAADFVINNSGTDEDLKKSVNFILSIVKNLKPKEKYGDE